MSWITNLAGKAENILNKIDSEAKTVLSEKGNNSTNIKQYATSHNVPSNLSTYGGYESTARTSSEVNTTVGDVTTSLNSSPLTQRNIVSKPKKACSADATFINFLNNDQTDINVPSMSAKSDDASAHIGSSHSRHSSMSSVSSYMAVSGRETPGFTTLDSETRSVGSGSGGSGNTDAYVNVDSQSDMAISAPTSDSSNSSSNSTTSPPVIISLGGSPMSSSVESESDMLRKELASLNQEMTQLLTRVKDAEKEVKQLKAEKADVRIQQGTTEALIRDLQQRNMDLQESVIAKDSQLAVLRVRLQEADQNISSNKEILEQLRTENSRLLEGANVSSGLHSQAITTIESRLKEVQGTLEREREQHRNAFTEVTKRVNELEEQQTTMAATVTSAHKKVQEEKNRSTKLDQQILNLKSELNSSQEELNDYKAKASRILQSKEKLITSLKEGRTEGHDDVLGNNQLIQDELDQIRSERDLLQEELESARMKIKQLQGEISELEIISQNEARSAADSLASLEQDIASERQSKHQIEEECNNAKIELKCAHEELTRQKVNISSRLQERDFEIQRLQKQIAHRQSSSSSQSELENRLRGLTESLIHKQTTIETLSTEKQSLLIQMERLQNQYKESQDMLNSDPPNISIHQDEIRNRVPTFMIESPFDGGVTRRVKRAYSTLDKFSVRLGVFLRRYPIARVFVILYMLLLHTWVMIVLLTYTPEVHGPEFKGFGTAPQQPIERN